METTTNYNLKMPNSAEVLKMDDINEDMKVIDRSLKGLDDKITEHEKNLGHIPYAVATGSSNSYEVTIDPVPAAYQDGMAVRVKINFTSTGASTLNVNGLGAKAILDCYGNPAANEGLKANTPYIMCYESVSDSFIVQGKGGGGNATADQILDGRTATVDNGPITGAMPNNGAVVITPGTKDIPIQKGYHNGNGYVQGDADLIPENIKAGVNIFGVDGKSGVVETSDGTATENEILDGYTAYVKGAKVTGAMPNNGSISEVLDINGTYIIPKGYHDGTGKVTQSIPTKEAETYTPGTTNQTIASGQYLSGDQTILGDANLVTGNIKSGTSIFGVAGKKSVVDTEDATAGAGDILSKKTAYANGAKVAGTMPDNGSVSQSLPVNGTYTIPAGYHNGSGKITQSIPVAGPDYADQRMASNVSCGVYSGDGKNYAYLGVPNGNYLSGVNWVRSYQPDLISQNILDGKNIFGISGSATIDSIGGRRYNSGNFTLVQSGSQYNLVADIGFTPKIFIYWNHTTYHYDARAKVYISDWNIAFGVSPGLNGSFNFSGTLTTISDLTLSGNITVRSYSSYEKYTNDHNPPKVWIAIG